MRIYLAARYSRLDELNGYRRDLEAIGLTVTSRWLNGNHQWAEALDVMRHVAHVSGTLPKAG